VGKHRSNPQYFKRKKLQSENFNQLNIKKVKSTKIIFFKKGKVGKEKKTKQKNKKNKKKCTVNYCCNPQCIECG